MNNKYIEGLDMEQFKSIPEISVYNWNYYIGFDKELLFGKSDDDDTTDWWVIDGEVTKHLGHSFTSEHDKLHLNDETIS